MFYSYQASTFSLSTWVVTEKLDILTAEHVLDVIWIDQNLSRKSWDVFEQYNVDKRWSFTDCTSYVVMKDFGITEVFAFDHHFEQMGFIRLPSLPI